MLWAVPQSRNASQALKILTQPLHYLHPYRCESTIPRVLVIRYANLEALGMHYVPIILIVTFNRVGIDVHIQIFAGHTLVQTEQIVTVRFKMRSGIERL